MGKSQLQTYQDFDPIKYDKSGKEAEAIVWTTATLNKAVTALKKGLPLKANPFIGKNTMLLKPNLVFARTEEEIEDYIHCMEDPVYFASKCFLMTPTGLKPCVLRDYQDDYLRHLQKNRFSIFLSCRQSGKCLIFFNKITIMLTNSFITTYKKRSIDYILKNYYFYIDSNNNYIIENFPIYEFQNLFENSLIWKIKYNLYKIMSWEENQKKKVKNFQNTIKRIFHLGH